ncbi:MAG: phosphoribosyltransferase [Betaproteobacteria bacterium HGW-Betaproteobacteria-12]|nr:MAG: phosphoribosyltransferase [Betaproteobacteria bacterium HGW-Betaproteobacteria-12]
MSILPQGLIAPVTHLARQCREALLPGTCLLCGGDAGKHLLCPDCHAELPAAPAIHCPQCAEPTTHGERCGACLKEPPYFDRTVALWRYDFPVDRIIHALKYQHRISIAGWLGQSIAVHLNADDQWLIPMPLHPARLRERGFNQALEIARATARQLQLPMLGNCLARQRPTPPQAELTPPERRRNVRGAFACNADLSGRHIILVDDVMTTGASVGECARVLKLHGAREITVAVAARALKH